MDCYWCVSRNLTALYSTTGVHSHMHQEMYKVMMSIMSMKIFLTVLWTGRSYWNAYFIDYGDELRHFPVEVDVMSDRLPVYFTVLLMWLWHSDCIYIPQLIILFCCWTWLRRTEDTYRYNLFKNVAYDLHQGMNSSSQIYCCITYQASILAGLWFSE
jgi:hypothetical protein